MIREELQDQLKELADETGFGEAADLLIAEAIECAYIHNDDNKHVCLGASRIGGDPDLAEQRLWPKQLDDLSNLDGEAVFLAQFNLANIPSIAELPLPKSGLLLMFSLRWGHTVSPAAGIYEAGQVATSSRPRSKPAKLADGFPGRFKPTAIRFELGLSLPYHRRSFREALNAAVPDGDPVELIEAIQGDSHGQIGGYSSESEIDLYRQVAFRELGWPEYIEADDYSSLAEYESDLALHTPCNPLPGYPVPAPGRIAGLRPKVEFIEQHRTQIDAETAQWKLLCSLKNNMKAGFHLGDALAFEVFIRSTDLQSCNFTSLRSESPMIL